MLFRANRLMTALEPKSECAVRKVIAWPTTTAAAAVWALVSFGMILLRSSITTKTPAMRGRAFERSTLIPLLGVDEKIRYRDPRVREETEPFHDLEVRFGFGGLEEPYRVGDG